MKKLLLMTFVLSLALPVVSFAESADTATASTPAGADFCNGDRVPGETVDPNTGEPVKKPAATKH